MREPRRYSDTEAKARRILRGKEPNLRAGADLLGNRQTRRALAKIKRKKST